MEQIIINDVMMIELLKKRFESHLDRHQDMLWNHIEARLKSKPQKLWSLCQMEMTGGEIEYVLYDKEKEEYIFMDCSKESPSGRRSLCYDQKALEGRKKFPPKDSVENMANNMGIELLDEAMYRQLQQYGPFDTKTSSWIKTPEYIRNLNGSLFGDHRYHTVFIYHNGAESYYESRGFRGMVRV